MNENSKEYQAIILDNSEISKNERIVIQANSLIEAENKLKKMFGDNVKFSLWNEEDANKIR